MWNCFGRRECNDELMKYIKQNGSGFPSPVAVLVPFDGSWVSLPRSIEWFQKYHANFQWIFSVRQHQPALQTFDGHVCQVITVTETEINVPLDGYRNCATRRLLTTAQDDRLRDHVPPIGSFTKDEKIRHQHRRLLLMLEESGIADFKLRRKTKARFSTCPQCSTFVSLDLPFSSCMVVFFIGCCLSLLAFFVEVTHPPHVRRER
ncbi:hypothetical protein HPB52_010938 [Rhipicephalus sanguineus]|uniref:Uncharacterized protein n=1 Tax=Rhipicephalus sanguineus TaxID=34632 RepID=A0A9D4PRC9_RHISA|nr:hypothetical protein HPB52_010938 [Rhipicephalus sanguineus]